MRSFLKKTLLFTLLPVVVFLATNANATVEGLRVSTPDTCWYQGTFINLPVSIEWTTWSADPHCTNNEYFVYPGVCDPAPMWPQSGHCRLYGAPSDQNPDELCSFELTMSWNPFKMQAVTVTGAELLEEFHWVDLYFDIDNRRGTITIAGAHSGCPSIDNITDPRELLYIGFLMKGSPGSSTGLQIDNFEYNEVDPCYVYWYNTDYPNRPDARSVGQFDICELLCVGGAINYCSNDIPICGADVTLHYVRDTTVVPPPDIPDTTVQTQCDANCQYDCRGEYLICDIVGGYDYCLSVWKDDEYDNAITAFDASLILRYIVNLLDFDCCQKVAADVSGNCCVKPYDASLILKYLVGEFDYFPKNRADQTNWIFFVECMVDPPGCPADDDCLCPVEEICFTPLDNTELDQDFEAVILGDVSGNWGVSTGGKMVVRDINDLCEVEVVSSNAEQTVYEINADFGEAYGFQFEMSGAEGIQVQIVESGWVHQINQAGDRVLVAAAGATPSREGLPLHIVVDNNANVTLGNLMVNESSVPGSLALKGATLPMRCELSNNYPNPFNPVTHISFSLPTKSEVTLSVFNILGQQVKTLASGAFEAGRHEIVWDGTNEAGEHVTSGIYLYRLEAGDFLETKKMVLLK